MLRRSLPWLLAPVFAFGQGSQLPKYTVATLPAASTLPSYTVQVIDGLNDQDCVTGGGNKNVLCKSRAGAWFPVSPFQSLTTTGSSGPATLNLGVLNVPNYGANSLAITASNCITVNGGSGPVSSGTAALSGTNCGGGLLRMNPGEDATHVFVPFGTCNFSSVNYSLVAFGACDAQSGSVGFYAGGLFNHNSNATMLWSNPTLPSWLPAGDVVSVQLVAYTGGFGSGPTSSCGGSGSCSSWVNLFSTGQTAVPITGVTGANFSSLTASAFQAVSVYCTGCASPFTITSEMNITQIGLLVEFTGVTNPNPSNALNVLWPLQYNHQNNSLGVYQNYPFQIAPVLTAYLPSASGLNAVAWVSDNTQTTPGATCTGSGTAGSDYALCVNTLGGWALLADLGGTGFGVTQVSNSDGSLTFSPNTGHVIGSINTGHINTWSLGQNFAGGVYLNGAHSVLNMNGDDGASGKCLIGQGAGNTPRWDNCAGGGTVTGSGTTGFYALWSASTALGNGSLDDAVTRAGFVTSSKPVQVVCPTCATQVDLTYNAGHAPAGTAGVASFAPDTSGNGTLSENGGSYSRICTAGNNQCPGGVTQIVAGTNVTISPVGGTGAVTINASGGGGGTPSGTNGVIQIANTGGTAFDSDSTIAIDKTNHKINVGTLGSNFVSIGALGTPTAWNFDTTSKATAALSLGSGTAGANKYIDGSAGAWTALPFTSLTTTGTSGAATLSGGVLNIPQYTVAGGYPTPVTTNVTSAASEIDITSAQGCITSTYSTYQIRFTNVKIAAGSGTIIPGIQFGLSGTWDTTSGHYLTARAFGEMQGGSGTGTSAGHSSSGIPWSLTPGDTSWVTGNYLNGVWILHLPTTAMAAGQTGEVQNTVQYATLSNGTTWFHSGGFTYSNSLTANTLTYDSLRVIALSGSGVTFTGKITCQPLPE